MKITPAQVARLEFLARVTDKECGHLQSTDNRLFGSPFSIEEAKKIEMDPILAERLDGNAQPSKSDGARVHRRLERAHQCPVHWPCICS